MPQLDIRRWIQFGQSDKSRHAGNSWEKKLVSNDPLGNQFSQNQIDFSQDLLGFISQEVSRLSFRVACDKNIEFLWRCTTLTSRIPSEGCDGAYCAIQWGVVIIGSNCETNKFKLVVPWDLLCSVFSSLFLVIWQLFNEEGMVFFRGSLFFRNRFHCAVI